MATEYTLFDNFELKGIWWLPSAPEDRVGGILSFLNQEHITLDLIGAFGDMPPFESKEQFQPEIILGYTDSGQLCTLCKNSEINRSGNFSAATKSKLKCRYLFTGKHYNSYSDIIFTGFQVNFTNLETWIGQSPFNFEFPKEKSGNIALSLHYQHPKVFEARVEAIESKIRSSSTFNTSGDHFRESIWKHMAFLIIEPDTPKPFRWHWKNMRELSNLFTLFVGDNIYPRRIIGLGEEITIRDNTKRREEVDIFYAFQKPGDEQKHHFDIVIPLKIIHSDIASILQNWFAKSIQLRSVYDLFFGTFYNPHMYPNFQFLSLMQAIESFHRVVVGGHFLSKNEWESYRAALSACIPETLESSHKDSLRSKIKFGFEFSLRKRINSLIDSLSEETRDAISTHRGSFTNAIVDTRNYLTHYDEAMRENALEGLSLYFANQQLKLLLMILLLREIGIPEEKAVTALLNNREYKFTISQIKERKSGKTQDQPDEDI